MYRISEVQRLQCTLMNAPDQAQKPQVVQTRMRSKCFHTQGFLHRVPEYHTWLAQPDTESRPVRPWNHISRSQHTQRYLPARTASRSISQRWVAVVVWEGTITYLQARTS
jgi:hypothetical protein